MAEGNPASGVSRPSRGNIAAASVVLAACAWYAYVARDMYFIFDEWSYWRTFVRLPLGEFVWEPYVDSLNAGLFVIWHSLAETVQMDYWPYRAVAIAFFGLSLAAVWLLHGAAGLSDRNRLFLLVLCAFSGPTIGNLFAGWQLAWTGAIAFGLLATYLAVSRRTSYLAVVPLGTAVLLGPAGLPFVTVVGVAALRLRHWAGVVGAAVVAAGWLSWRNAHASDGLREAPALLRLDYWEYVAKGATSSVRGLLGAYWLLTALALVALAYALARRRIRGEPANPIRTALAIAGLAGFVSWWLTVAQGRLKPAFFDPVSFSPDVPRYQHVAVVMLVLCAPWVLARLRLSAFALGVAAVPLVAAGMVWAALWVDPYVTDARLIRASVCSESGSGSPGGTPSDIAWLREHGYLECGPRTARR